MSPGWLILVATLCAGAATPDDDGTVDLTILHTNDMHSRFAETDSSSNECSDADARANRCFGGFPRLVHT